MAHTQKTQIFCKWFGHKWQGCKCQRCGFTRDEGHKWDGCKCAVCGEVRNEGHKWVYYNCQKCKQSSPIKYYCKDSYSSKAVCKRRKYSAWENRDEAKCFLKCERCGRDGLSDHQFKLVEERCCQQCTNCGYIKPIDHKWNGCTCRVCGKKRDEGHNWVQDGCNEKCTICGKKQASGKWHNWIRNGCIERCSVCGEQRESHEYRLISHEVSYGTGKCYRADYNDDYACRFCNTPNACLQYPQIDKFIYTCSRCGESKTYDDMMEHDKGNVFLNDMDA